MADSRSRSLFSPLALTIILFSSFYLSNCYISTGYEVRDLQKTNSCFRPDANLWTATAKPPGQPIYSQCDNTYLVGGAGILGNPGQTGQSFWRTYSGLKSHSMVYFSMKMFAIDKWSSGNMPFQIQVGTKVFNSWTSYNFPSFPQDYCGGGQGDLKDIWIFGTANHVGTSLTFKVISTLNQNSNVMAFGFRELSLLFASPTSPPPEAMCGKASLAIGGVLECPCNPGYYKNTGGVCTKCHDNCASCFGGGADQCYACNPKFGFDGTSCIACHPYCTSCFGSLNTQCGSCISNYLLFANTTCVKITDCQPPLIQTGCGVKEYCETPCAVQTDFLYWDGDCLPNCPLPLQQPAGLAKICQFPCESGQYLYWDGGCSTVCNQPPTGPLLTVDPYKGEKFCKYPCLAGEYLYWDGTCLPTCTFPLTSGTMSGKLFCYYPCAATGEFLYWDGSCSSTCSSPPLMQRYDTVHNRWYCDYPCVAGKYRTWHGTCSDTCDFPYVQRIEKDQNFCDHPCPGSQFLYWDNTCSATCGPYLTQSTLVGKRFCSFPCPANEYLYWNGTCSAVCNMPLTRSFIGDKSFCEYPCVAGEFLYPNGSCINNCKAPFGSRVEAGKDYCEPLCPPRYALFWNGTCISSCRSPLRYATNSSGTYCVDPCNSPTDYYNEETGQCSSHCNTVTILEKGLYLRCVTVDPIQPLELVKLLHHIRYLDVKLPPKLQQITVSRSMNIFTPRIIPSMFDGAREWVLREAAPLDFENYVFQSSFLANFLDDLILLGIVLFMGIMFEVIEKASKLFKLFYSQIVFERLSILTKWNLFLILMTTNAGDIILYSVLEFKAFHSGSIQANLSLIICIVMLSALLLLFIFNYYLLHRIQDFKIKNMFTRSNVTFPDFLLKWQTCQVLFRGLNEARSLTLGFYMIYEARIALPMLIASTLWKVPLIQACFYIIISILILLFIHIYRPLKKKIDHINLFILEMIILIVNFSALGLAICEARDADFFGLHKFLGDVIIAGNFCIHLLAGAFLVVKIWDGVRYALLVRRKYPTEEIGAWAQLFFIPLQQGGLGFEQVQMVTAFTVSRIKSYNEKGYPKEEEVEIELDRTPSQHKIQTQDPNTSSPLNDTVVEKPLDLLKPPETEAKVYKISEFKKRRYNYNAHSGNSSIRPEPTFETIEEEIVLTDRPRNLNDDSSAGQVEISAQKQFVTPTLDNLDRNSLGQPVTTGLNPHSVKIGHS